MNILDCKQVYFLGIGGIGMSAIARYLNQNGIKVSGYDKVETPLTRKLESEGIEIHYEDEPSTIPRDLDMVIYTPAIPNDLMELMYLKEEGHRLYKRAEVLGMISKVKKTIGIAGTHGKTSTSTMLTYLLRECGIDCTAFLGGISHNYETNFIAGDSEYVVVEADEYDRSFLHLRPYMAAIMSMDPDHLDIYDHPDVMNQGYNDYLSLVNSGGLAMINGDFIDQLDQKKLGDKDLKIKTFGEKSSDIIVDNIRVEEGFYVFDYQGMGKQIEGLQLALPGRHNVQNASVAISVALELGITPESVKRALPGFSGIQRRFDVYRGHEAIVINDYAHHPTELRAAIGAAKEMYPDQFLTGVFQPHLFTRTRDFADGFADALCMLDKVILLDIYPARELPIEGVTSQMLLDKMDHNDKHLWQNEELIENLRNNKPEILMLLGAGDIDDLLEPIKDILIN